MSRALDLLAALRLLPSPLLSTWIYQLARGVAADADRQAARAERATGERDEARRDATAARAAEQACYEREAATGRARSDEIARLKAVADAARAPT